MSKKKVLLRGVFINRDTNGEGVLKVGTTLIRVSTVVGILYKSIDKIDRTDFWIWYIILLIVDFIVNYVLAMIQLSLHTDFTSISGIIIIMIIYNLLAFICFYELGKK